MVLQFRGLRAVCGAEAEATASSDDAPTTDDETEAEGDDDGLIWVEAWLNLHLARVERQRAKEAR